jgi:type IV pilus assembly protein PilQ
MKICHRLFYSFRYLSFYAFSISFSIAGLSASRDIQPSPIVNANSAFQQEQGLVSMTFQDAPLRDVLYLFAEHNDLNLVVSDSVSGQISIKLDHQPWQQALDILLYLKNLVRENHGNVMIILPREDSNPEEKAPIISANQASLGASLMTDVIVLEHASASEIAELVSGEGSLAMLSSNGKLSVDGRSNAIIIRDKGENIDSIKKMAARLDRPIKQVQIEAYIVTVQEGNLEDLGIRWGIQTQSNEPIRVSRMDGNMLDVDLSVVSPSLSNTAFKIAKLSQNILLDMELSALQKESKAEVISSPKLLTTNKRPAYIEQGSEIPYLEASSSGAASIAFKKAVLSLKVTPQITSKNDLLLDLQVTQDRPGNPINTGSGQAVAINTQRIGTQVLVKDGETIVLGGIFQHSMSNAVDKVPLLGDVPLLGALFRRNYLQENRSELLIFVTPKVL